MMGFVVFGRNFDTRHPRAEELFYAIDVEGQRGLWVSSDVREGSWLDNFIGKNSSKFNMNQIIPGYDQITLIRETPMPDYEPATLEITRNRVADGAREIHMHLQSPAAAEYINLLFPVSAHISSAKVNGFPVPVPTQKREPGAMYKAYAMKEADEVLEENWWRWRWYGLPSEGAEIVLTADAAHPLPIMIIEVDYGTPDDAPARPPQSMPRPYTWSDSTVIYQTVVLE